MTPKSFQDFLGNHDASLQANWRRLPVDCITDFMSKLQYGLVNKNERMTAGELKRNVRKALKDYQIQNIKPFDMLDYPIGKQTVSPTYRKFFINILFFTNIFHQ